ncbi:hypothetical protein [Escherichia coli]|uniref:hypothetical protein n=1 Tax=Escherichia coli TaxID=562 RepID=UPI0039A32FA1
MASAAVFTYRRSVSSCSGSASGLHETLEYKRQLAELGWLNAMLCKMLHQTTLGLVTSFSYAGDINFMPPFCPQPFV